MRSRLDLSAIDLVVPCDGSNIALAWLARSIVSYLSVLHDETDLFAKEFVPLH